MCQLKPLRLCVDLPSSDISPLPADASSAFREQVGTVSSSPAGGEACDDTRCHCCRIVSFVLASVDACGSRFRFVSCSPNGTRIVQYIPYDDDNDPLVFSLIDTNPPGPLTLSHDGLLFVDTAKGWLDYEVMNTYHLTSTLAEVSNAFNDSPALGSLQGDVAQLVSVMDVNELPYFVSLPVGYNIDELSVYPTLVQPGNGSASEYIVVFDEDFGNNSALVVNTVSFADGHGTGYFEVVNTTGGQCRGNMNCVMRVTQSSPRIHYTPPDFMRYINVTVVVTDPTGLTNNSGNVNVTINEIDEGKQSCRGVVCAECVVGVVDTGRFVWSCHPC